MKNIIFDTDIGGDSDDITALDLLISAHKNNECRLLGVTYSAFNDYAPGCIRSILRQHGVPEIPVGTRPYKPGWNDSYSKAVAEMYPDTAKIDTMDSVSLIRKLISENQSVTIVATGSLYNISMLLKSGPDTYSSLNGMDLVREKVDEFAVMAGNFSHQNCNTPMQHAICEDGSLKPVSEYNVTVDPMESVAFFRDCPVPCVLIPWEVGVDMITAKPVIDLGGRNNPDSLGYIMAGHINGNHSWDPLTAYYAVYGARPYLYLTCSGSVRCTEDSLTDFLPGNGNFRIAYNSVPKEELAEVLNGLIMRLFR